MLNETPVFVKLEECDEVRSIVAVIRKKLDETKDTLLRIKQLKTEEEQELLGFEDNLKDMYERIEFIDEILQKPRF
mgnify:CR=1 FL=1